MNQRLRWSPPDVVYTPIDVTSFTLSQTNSFDGAGHSGGYPVSSSGVDVTVDGWTATTTANTLGVAGGGTGINVAIRSLRFSASNSEDIKITNNTINNPTP